MNVKDAIDLIAGLPVLNRQPSRWADLGCGTGLFTVALVHYLAPGSIIYAVDKEKIKPPVIPVELQIRVEPLVLDFSREQLPLNGLSGILMANSLHYVKDKLSFINTVKTRMLSKHHWILVEYDTERSNPWVPYPVSFSGLNSLFAASGYPQGKKLNERSSVYGRANLYAACFVSD
jgi:hypothetical protein